jgi:hypothetical protein
MLRNGRRRLLVPKNHLPSTPILPNQMCDDPRFNCLLRVVCARMMFLCFLFRDFTNIVWEIESRSHDKGRKKEDAAIREQ